MVIALVEARQYEDFSKPLPNGNFQRMVGFKDAHRSLSVKLLDEKIILYGGGTAHVRQFFLGHYDSPIASNWKKHWGWQGAESIREYYLFKMNIGGSEEVVTREIDVSDKIFRFG